MHPSILDANLNRLSEGLRVIEDYCRFVASAKELSQQLATLRQRIPSIEGTGEYLAQLQSRDTESDMRAGEVPATRQDTQDVLTANFKRAQQALRVLEEYSGNAQYTECRYQLYDLEKDLLLLVAKPEIKPGVYLISDQVSVLEKGLDWGVSFIQLRDKHADKASIFKRCQQIVPTAKAAGIPFIVNDFLDIAVAVDADGLHSGQDDIPIPEIRKILGDHRIIGRSTHSLDQGQAAQAAGADYVSVGPLWETPSKPGRSAIGLDYLKAAAEQLHIPYVAIGGISMQQFPEVMSYQPPMIGLIRDYENVPEMLKAFESRAALAS